MLDPEYYVGAFRSPGGLWTTRKYSDQSPEQVTADKETVIWARKPLYCCRVPGESSWCAGNRRQEQVTKPAAFQGRPLYPLTFCRKIKMAIFETDGDGVFLEVV